RSLVGRPRTALGPLLLARCIPFGWLVRLRLGRPCVSSDGRYSLVRVHRSYGAAIWRRGQDEVGMERPAGGLGGTPGGAMCECPGWPTRAPALVALCRLPAVTAAPNLTAAPDAL